jgi:hypothetical protein
MEETIGKIRKGEPGDFLERKRVMGEFNKIIS